MNKGFNSFWNTILFLVAVVLMIAAFIFPNFFPDFSEKEIKGECNQWQSWARETRKDLFSPSAEMVRECRKVGVELPAKK